MMGYSAENAWEAVASCCSASDFNVWQLSLMERDQRVTGGSFAEQVETERGTFIVRVDPLFVITEPRTGRCFLGPNRTPLIRGIRGDLL